MPQANDSVLVTPGLGATIATHLANSKEHQAVVLADADGYILNSKPAYFANIPSQVHVAAANTVHWDLFNADASLIVRVFSILQIPNIVTAVTGVAFAWTLGRTTSAGTGGTGVTPWPYDSNTGVVPALDANITLRSKPTGDAAAGTILRNYNLHGEETNTGSVVIASLGGLELVPPALAARGGIVLRQNEGLRCVQVTNSAAGNTGWLIGFTVDG